jgi:taurine dioxygenase
VNVVTKPATLTVNKLSPNIGAEVIGIDLSKPIDERTRQQLIDALHENIFLVIRDQKFDTPEKYLQAGSAFGELMEQDQPEVLGLPGYPKIRMISNRQKDQTGKVSKSMPDWHTDHTHFARPPKYTSMYPLHLPTSGGGTSLANMRLAYARLSPEEQQRFAGMKTVNVLAGSAAKGLRSTQLEGMKSGGTQTAVQPFVRTHPDHGSKALYFQPRKTENIVGMTPEETQDLFEGLLKKIIQPDNSITHKWRMGDMLIWDNRSALHKANDDFDPSQLREFYRITVLGETPY